MELNFVMATFSLDSFNTNSRPPGDLPSCLDDVALL